jgi:UPF0716 protein FxsA
MYLFLAFLLVPIIEIALFIQIGGLLGLWPTLLIVVLTAILGTTLVRNQGLAALGQIQSSINGLRNPSEPLAHGAMILGAGALLLTPGFFTDAAGFALLVPFVRIALFKWLKKRVVLHSFNAAGGFQANQNNRPHGDHTNDAANDVIDGEWEEVKPKPRSRPSGWVDDKRN